jgi:SulP family sulfate permease
MTLGWQTEWDYVRTALRQRFHAESVDWAAPLRLLRPEARRHWRGDALGGLGLMVMAVPQVLAYAMIAGVPPVMGLYSLVVVTLVAALWCATPHLSFGPSNASSLMLGVALLTMGSAGSLGAWVALVALVMGLFQVVAAVLGAGGLTKYISRSVIVGYTTAIGALIFFNQIGNLVGVEVTGAKGLFAKVWANLRALPRAEPASAATAVVTLGVIWWCARRWKRVPAGFAGIVAGGLFAWGLRRFDAALAVRLVQDVQPIPAGLPVLVAPALNLDAIYELVGPAIALGLLASIEVSAAAKNLAMRTGQRHRPNQDILALGFGNIAGAFFGAMPGSVSFTRSEFSYRSGARSRLAMVFCALLSLVAVLTARPLLNHVPIPALAALIMWLSIKLIEPKLVRVALRSTYSDALVFLATFLAAIFLRLDTAIYLGTLVSMALFVQKASRPQLMEFEFDRQGRFRPVAENGAPVTPQISIVHVEGELFFGAAENLEEQLWKTVDLGRTQVLVLRLRNAHNLDASGAMILDQLIRNLRDAGLTVLVSGTSPEIDRVFVRSGLHKVVGEENYFPSRGNFLEATRRAVIRANQIVGVEHPGVRLFYDRDQEQRRVGAREPATAPATAAEQTESENRS